MNDPPQQNRDAARREQEQLQAANTNLETEQKDLLTLEEYPQVNLRDQRIQQNEEPRNEEKYVAQMPNGAWCVIGHEDGKVIKCFDTEKEANAYLKRKPKKDYDNIVNITADEDKFASSIAYEIENDSENKG